MCRIKQKIFMNIYYSCIFILLISWASTWREKSVYVYQKRPKERSVSKSMQANIWPICCAWITLKREQDKKDNIINMWYVVVLSFQSQTETKHFLFTILFILSSTGCAISKKTRGAWLNWLRKNVRMIIYI